MKNLSSSAEVEQLIEDQLNDNEVRGPYTLLQGASRVVRLCGETLRKWLVSVGLVESHPWGPRQPCQ